MIPLGVVLLGALPVLLELTERRTDAASGAALIWLAGNTGGIVVAVLVQALSTGTRRRVRALGGDCRKRARVRLKEAAAHAANTTGMSETDHRTEPHVSTEELRAALAPREGTRRNPVLVTEHAEHAEGEIARSSATRSTPRTPTRRELRTELDRHRRAIDAARADTIELRAALDAARGDAAELRAELATAKAEARERRNALEKLANAGLLQAPQGHHASLPRPRHRSSYGRSRRPCIPPSTYRTVPVVRGRGRQVDDRLGDLVRADQAPHRLARLQRRALGLGVVGGVEQPPDPRRVGRARRDAVHADALADVVGGHRQRQRHHRALGRAVERAVRDARRSPRPSTC